MVLKLLQLKTTTLSRKSNAERKWGYFINYFNISLCVYLSLSIASLLSDQRMPVVKSASTTESTTNEAREALDCLHELSQLLNTGLDKKTLTACVRLLEAGVHPDALAQIIQVLRSEMRPTKF